MTSMLNTILSELDKMKIQVSNFLKEYTNITKIPEQEGFLIFGPTCSYLPLKEEAVPLQNKLFQSFNRLSEVIRVLLLDSPKEYNKIFDNAVKIISGSIAQDNKLHHYGSVDRLSTEVIDSFSELSNMLKALFGKSGSVSVPLLVPDTNALYTNGEMEKWKLEGIAKFTIAITPSVLRDLDKHKIEHRNEAIRDKAGKLIKKIKEYRRRGHLGDGIEVVKDKVSLFTIAMEPKFEKSLSWLDPQNEDDRLVAEVLEIIRQFAGSPVLIVTADINLQNKLENAGVPALEPDEL